MNRHSVHHRRGATIVEALALLMLVAVFGPLGIVACTGNNALALQQDDQVSMQQIHMGWLIFAVRNRPYSDLYPTPGLKRRLPVNGQRMPGRGAEDVEANDHANVHSLAIMENLYPPERCISPAEQSSKVVPMIDYDFSRYDVHNAVYWDERFQADLDSRSHVSYAAVPLAGDRKTHQWKDSRDHRVAAIGNRGPRNGDADAAADSITSRFHGPSSEWNGNICYHDNSCSYEWSFFPERLKRVGDVRDNLFANDTAGADSSRGSDVWLVVVKAQRGDETDTTLDLSWD